MGCGQGEAPQRSDSGVSGLIQLCGELWSLICITEAVLVGVGDAGWGDCYAPRQSGSGPGSVLGSVALYCRHFGAQHLPAANGHPPESPQV